MAGSGVVTNRKLELQYRKLSKDFVPFFDIIVTEDMRQALLRGFDEHLWIRRGPTWDSQGKKFEDEICQFAGCKYAVSMTSGTAALLVALKAWGVESGDEVITVPNTFPSPSDAIMWAGATPVYVDIEPDTFCMDVSRVEDAITPRTKVIMPVDAHGHAVDMDPLLEIAGKHGLYVLDDACQAIGAGYKGKKVGTLAHCGAYSFTRNKPMACGGDGGVLVTNDKDLADKAWMLAYHGWGPKYFQGWKAETGYRAIEHEVSGLNFRWSEPLAAVARVNLRHLQQWNERRRQIAARYNQLLGALDTDLILPIEKPYAWHSYWRYVVRTPSRDKLRLHLIDHVETLPSYGTPNHLDHIIRSKYGYKEGDFPITEQSAKENLGIPVYPALTDRDVDFVVEKIASFYRG